MIKIGSQYRLERDLIEKIGGLYRDLWLGAMGTTPPPGESPAYTSARYLANHMPEVPAMILVCADHTKGTVPYAKGDPIERGRYASSLWLAVQNLFLAARALGLGTRITTTHLREEQEVKDWLGIPDHVETVCLTPLGCPSGRFGPTDRIPSADVSSYNRFGGGIVSRCQLSAYRFQKALAVRIWASYEILPTFCRLTLKDRKGWQVDTDTKWPAAAIHGSTALDTK